MLRQCYSQTQGETTQEGARPQYARTSTVYAIREWLLPHKKGVHRLHNFHAFTFVRGEGKKAEMLCKPWCVSQYDPAANPPVTLLHSRPQGYPELVKPQYEAVDLGRIRGMVRKCVDAGVFREDEEREWNAFLEREEHLAASFIDVEERTYLTKDQREYYLMLFNEINKRLQERSILRSSRVSYHVYIYFEILDGYKYHKKELTYMECVDDTWIVDDLRNRPRVTPTPNIQLSSILQKSAELERGDGLLPVSSHSYTSTATAASSLLSHLCSPIISQPNTALRLYHFE